MSERKTLRLNYPPAEHAPKPVHVPAQLRASERGVEMIDPFESDFARWAEGGDAGFAIAYGLMRVAHAVRDLGFGNRMEIPGTGEKLAMEAAEIAKALGNIADAVVSRHS